MRSAKHAPAAVGGGADVLASSLATVASSLPAFLIGALAVQLRGSLRFGAGTLGLIVAFYYLGAGVTSMPLGSVVESVGGLRAMRLACVVSALLLALCALVGSWPPLAVAMVAAGAASSAAQIGANQFLARTVPDARQGLAFGLKQAAVPLASALAGLAVPAVALTVGWRWAFAIAAAGAAGIAATLPAPRQTLAQLRAASAAARLTPLDRRPLVALAVGIGLGVAAASALTTFLVSSAVASGIGRGTAGLLVALGGVLAAAGRVAAGRRADRRGRAHLPVIAAMLGIGAVGYGLFALASAQRLAWLYLPAVVVVFAAGWGWNGLFNFAVVRTHRDQPARATALTQTGARLGAVLGPFVFGEVVLHGSYALAWGLTAATAALAAGVMLIARRLLRSSRGAVSDAVRL
jgi:MFS family permease